MNTSRTVIHEEQLVNGDRPSVPPQGGRLQALGPRLVELWISVVLIAFFFLRVLGSQTAKRFLGWLQHPHFS